MYTAAYIYTEIQKNKKAAHFRLNSKLGGYYTRKTPHHQPNTQPRCVSLDLDLALCSLPARCPPFTH